eukprot:SAG25_NODE_11607_length_300_cov_0.771144_1_plen_99_part_11
MGTRPSVVLPLCPCGQSRARPGIGVAPHASHVATMHRGGTTATVALLLLMGSAQHSSMNAQAAAAAASTTRKPPLAALQRGMHFLGKSFEGTYAYDSPQ